MTRVGLVAIGLALVAGCKRSPTRAAPPAGDATPATVDAAAAPPYAAVERGLVPNLGVAGVDLRARLATRMRAYGVPAVGVAVVADGRLAWAHSWGVRARGDAAPVDDATLFQAASVSKPVTAMAVLRLVQDGKLDLDADVATYLRGWTLPPGAGEVTLRRLLSHTAGVSAPEQLAYIHPDGTFGGYRPGQLLPTTAQLLAGAPPAISAAVTVTPPDPPRFAYSGGGYTIIQQIIEDVTGQPFAVALAELVLRPAGMTRSTFAAVPPDDDVARAHAAGGAPVDGGWIVVPEQAAGGLWTTPGDLGRLLVDLIGAYRGEPGHVLTPASARLMLTPVADARPTMAGAIGLGMFVSDDGGAPWCSHNGHNPGFHATIAAMPAQGKAVVILTNREDGVGLAGELANAIGEVYDWPARTGMRPRQRAVVPVVAAAVAGFAGRYQGGGVAVVVRVDEARVFATVGDAAEAEVYSVGPDTFLEPWAPAALVFQGGALVLDRPTGKLALVRAP